MYGIHGICCNSGDLGLILGLGRSPGEGKGYPFQCSGLENSMDCIVHGVTKNRTGLSNFHFHFLGFPDSLVGKESACNAGDPVLFWVGKIPWRRDRLPTPVFLGFPCGSAGKESTCNVGELGLIPGLGRSPEEGKGYPFQCSGLENSMDCIVHGVANSWTGLSNFHFHFHH